MATRRSNAHGQWSERHRKTLIGGKHVFVGSADWARTSLVGNFRDDCQPTYQVPAAMLPSIKAAWLDLGPEILAAWKTAGRRPWGWWVCQSKEPRDLRLCEPVQLHLMGEIDEQEFSLPSVQRDVANYHPRENAASM
jgi:hypothetical protein